MNRLNRKVEYALMALKYLMDQNHLPSSSPTPTSELNASALSAAPSTLASAKDIAESLKAPFDATARVMQIMAHHQILRAEMGVHGGYRLIGDLTHLSLFQLMEMIEGPAALVKCAHGEDRCELQVSCNIVQPLTQLNHRFEDFFKSIKVSDLLNSPNSYQEAQTVEARHG